MTHSPPARRVLLTGFPTFAARYLLWVITEAEPDTHVTCVVTEELLGRAQALIDARDLQERVTLLTGDVSALDLGLSGREYLDITTQVTDIYHLASAWTTTTNQRLLRQVNVVGTQNVLQCVRDAKQLNLYNHFSTAFVCGDATGVIMEEELRPDARRNPYEASQYEAEVAVRALRDQGVPINIYRPATIVGHSGTGQIDHLTGPYLFFKPMVRLPNTVPIPVPSRGSSPLNIVPIDYVVEALYRISVHPDVRGRTYHLVDPNPLSAARVFELVAVTAGRPLPRTLPRPFSRVLLNLPYVDRALETGRAVLTGFDRWTIFNAMNTAEVTRSGPWCPAFADYVEPLVEYVRSGEGAA